MSFNLAKKAALGAGLLLAASGASAATVTFSNFNDSDNSAANYSLALNAISGNHLDLGLNNFAAIVANGPGLVNPIDTVSFTVTAPTGWVITNVSYTETGTGKTVNGFAAASGSVVADGFGQNLAGVTYLGNANGPWMLGTSVAINNKQSISVQVTNSLFAGAFTSADSAKISKTSAYFDIEVAPVPLPPALGMLGAGVLALATVGGRRRNA